MKYPNQTPATFRGGPLDGQEVTGRGRSIYRLPDGTPCAPNHGDRRVCYHRWQRGESGIYAHDYTKDIGEHYRWITSGPAYRDLPQSERIS